MSDLTKYDWGRVWEMTVYEFFNYISFLNKYNEEQKRLMQQYTKRYGY